MPDLTPMMQQYARVKQEHRDAILFFRLGDFYEMFRGDAEEASRLLGLTLTSRQGVPMCGVPYHAAHTYIARLIREGRKVAVCEQTRVPPAGRGLAEREVVEIITPGTATEEDYLEARSNNFIVSIGETRGLMCLAYADLSTGELGLAAAPEAAVFLRDQLARLRPREILVQQSLLEDRVVDSILAEREGVLQNRLPDWEFDLADSHARLRKLLRVANLKAFGIADDAVLPFAAGVLVAYLEESARTVLPHVRSVVVEQDETFVGLDESTVRNLELVANMQDGSRRFTLLEVIDRTRTVMGARMLRRWVLSPLRDVSAIEARQTQVATLYHDQATLSRVREELGRVLDMERLLSRVGMERAHAKDLVAIRTSVSRVRTLWGLLEGHGAGTVAFCTRFAQADRAELDEVLELLERSLLDEPSTLLTEGRLIRDGYDPGLDGLRELRDNSRSILEAYIAEERRQSGVTAMKVRYNKVLGHFIEVTRSQADRVPGHFIRRQTLTNAERFTTERLGEIESAINDAAERIAETERRLFLDVRARVASRLGLLLSIARAVAELDVLQGLAYAATINGYARPVLAEDCRLTIAGGRHPVVEANLPSGSFVPNATSLGPDETFFALITGPNMAGKSTYLRQVALIVILAQIGSYVPADEAEIGLVDRVFCRVGASDNLARGESTFLVEMNEAAYILRAATASSLVIMDEIGRGTSTNDGLAIAQAVSEDLAHRVRCRTLFATHFHELTAMQLPGMANYSLQVADHDGTIVFLKRIEPGPSSTSYGIHVAELAGLPGAVVERAAGILAQLVSAKEGSPSAASPGGEDHWPARPGPSTAGAALETSLFTVEELIAQEIRSLNVDELRPLDALEAIDRWRRELSDS